jgi:5-oxoprolinase (ATP-hydrolysing) subunit A
MHIDLNSDLGEGCAHDVELLSLITSANVACGWHAGDAGTAMTTLTTAARQGVVVGAHPSFPDREHFGRLELARTPSEIYQDCVYQIGALVALARAAGTEVRYIKPHGALYNMACRDETFGRAVLEVAQFFALPLVGLPGSRLEVLSRKRLITEGFVDRRYRPDGSLVPRDQPDAFVHDPTEALRQALDLIHQRGIQTLCVHGDNPQALELVRALREGLTKAGFELRAFA